LFPLKKYVKFVLVIKDKSKGDDSMKKQMKVTLI